MHAQEFIQSKSHQLVPIYVLYGEESYFIQEVKKRIENQIKKQDPEFDRNTYDMETLPIQEAIHDAETFPFFSEHKLVEVQRAYFLTGQKVKSDIEHQIDVLEEFAHNPVEFTTLIIVVPYEKMDQRKKIVKTLKNCATFIECSSPKAYEMGQVIRNLAESKGMSLSEELIELIAERVGEHIEAVQHELDKLNLYFNDQPISLEEAKEIISIHAKANTFNLIDHLVEFKVGPAIQLLKELKKQNEEPIGLLALISSQIRIILQVKLLKQKGYQQQQIAKQLQVHPYAVKMALKRERRFTDRGLKDMLMEAAITDEKMKTGKIEQWLALELFLQRVVQRLKEVS
ncbi:DNA polymerase III subunit delta [Piscibacillus halophilus]|uniref:DNA polymerase III subunit delta n=1 Tax=Piscibacillus halophilus TaxID=571933 RepID=A0A1H9BPP9_9BACI|nr:DNA polymerase III subunit delta [Piscibacillus halophilus]SEP90865.1 DNA polymerase III, delta subunit [Piscibacillus halophilus]